jgi:sec-independent protein translocase protein TatB
MFDFGIGYTELVVIALVAIIVIGPKDLPRVLRGLGRMMTKMRGMAREFQGHMDAAMKEAGLDEVKKDLQSIRNPVATIKDSVTAELKKQETDFKKQDEDFKKYFGTMNETPKPEASTPPAAVETEKPAEPSPSPPPAKVETPADLKQAS